MIIDMHVHSVSSDDSRATVEQYLKWVKVLRGRGYWIDGIALTEHRKFDWDADYSELAERYHVLVLKGSELDTTLGHFLVYGVTDALLKRLDFGDVTMDGLRLVREAQACGAIAVPAHPGRFGVGLLEFMQRDGHDLPDVWVVETLNGGNRQEENERAARLAQERGYWGTGGSDAHFVSAIGTCLTEFQDAIRNEEDLVSALHHRRFRTLLLEETLQEDSTEVAP